MRIITIQENDAGQRLDKFLMKYMPAMPKSMLYKLIRKKEIKYNQKRCQGNEILQPGDMIRIYAKDEFFEKKQKIISAEPSSLQIIFENQDLIIVRKPVGQDVHSGGHHDKNVLIDEIIKYLYDTGAYDPKAEQSFTPAVCNRIDRNTEGLVIAAKNAAALRAVNEAIRQRQIQKIYLAVTERPLPKQKEICTAWLKKDSNSNYVHIADHPSSGWQEIRTAYEVIAQNGQKQLVRIHLLTGRTHQIRAHMAFIGSPLLGDVRYGGKAHAGTYQCLCAYQLSFSEITSPLLAELKNKIFTAPIPDFIIKYFPDFK